MSRRTSIIIFSSPLFFSCPFLSLYCPLFRFSLIFLLLFLKTSQKTPSVEQKSLFVSYFSTPPLSSRSTLVSSYTITHLFICSTILSSSNRKERGKIPGDVNSCNPVLLLIHTKEHIKRVTISLNITRRILIIKKKREKGKNQSKKNSYLAPTLFAYLVSAKTFVSVGDFSRLITHPRRIQIPT